MDVVLAKHEFANVIDLSQYEIEDFLGKGGNGRVYGIRDIKTGKVYAMKVIPKKSNGQNLSQGQIDILKKEAEVQMKFKHPNIVQVELSFDTNDYVIIIMDKCGGDLSKIGGQGKRIPTEKALMIFRQVVAAVAYIHEDEEYAYRDIKTENIINCGGDVWKLIDFGYAVPEDELLDSSCCTIEYMAPESLQYDPYLGQPVDIWGLGVLLYEILTGKTPFDRKNERLIYNAIKNDEPDYSKIENPKIIKLLKRMLDKNPDTRANISEVRYFTRFLEK